MILSCNSCEKKFVVPDNAITDSGSVSTMWLMWK